MGKWKVYSAELVLFFIPFSLLFRQQMSFLVIIRSTVTIFSPLLLVYYGGNGQGISFKAATTSYRAFTLGMTSGK